MTDAAFAMGWAQVEARWRDLGPSMGAYKDLLQPLLDDERWTLGVRSVLLCREFAPRPVDFLVPAFEREYEIVLDMVERWRNEGKGGSWVEGIARLSPASRLVVRDAFGGYMDLFRAMEDAQRTRRRFLEGMERAVVHHGQRLGEQLLLDPDAPAPRPRALLGVQHP